MCVNMGMNLHLVTVCIVANKAVSCYEASMEACKESF